LAERSGSVWYTTHYYGRTIEEFLDVLVAHRVGTLVDTRSQPASRRPEYGSQRLGEALRDHSVVYLSAPGLGCPRRLRLEAWRTGDYSGLWDWYTRNVVETVFWGYVELLRGYPAPVALMCVERDPALCHRHLLADALRRAGYTVAEI